MLSLENLKIKPLPKKPKKYTFSIDNKFPNIIDKTGEKKIDVNSFMNKINDNLNIQNNVEILQSQPNKIKTTISSYKVIIENIIKTGETIIIKDNNFEYNKQEHKSKEAPDFEDIYYEDTIPIKDKKTILPDIEKSTSKINIDKKTKEEYKQEYLLDIDKIKDTKLGDTTIINRLPKPQKHILVKAPDYYLYNREIFINFVNKLFLPYKEQLLQEEQDIKNGKIVVSCEESNKSEFSLLTHQKIVRDYINLYTPYRGLLLYHGLGSGKTCSSIAIAEGLKSNKQIICMLPASLRSNFYEELKKCGDYMYKKNQYWEFIDTNLYPQHIETLSNILKIPIEYIRKHNGAWFINVKKNSNYENLSFEEQQQINEQIDYMINYKYEFINYNGIRHTHLQSLTKNFTINPFDNKVVIIDEAHNLISRIVNKLNKNTSLSMKLYEYLMDAENCKIILLSGTPIINYPNEIGILFNILRGYITTLTCKFVENHNKNINLDYLIKLFQKHNIYNKMDTIDYNNLSKKLEITKNPFGFITTKDNKITIDTDDITITKFKQNILDIFKKNNIEITGNKIQIIKNKALPDDYETFRSYFIDINNKMKNVDMFKMRIIGLTSYFRSAQEQLMPKYDDTKFNIIHIEMSDFQFGVYQEARIEERNLEKKNQLKLKIKKPEKNTDIYNDSVSTYRIFSRAFCNFVFPKPHIIRPMPNKDGTISVTLDNLEKTDVNEDILDDITAKDKINNMDNIYEEDDIEQIKEQQSNSKDNTYNQRIKDALNKLDQYSDKFLNLNELLTYSPKFLAILQNIISSEHVGIHLLYSQFKTLEGIGIFKIVLKQNGFTEFKLFKNAQNEYDLDIKNTDIGKPMYASYSGDETPEEREIIKNVLNSNWKVVPSNILLKIKNIAQNNYYGQIIKVLMITSSGAEGISLKNVRYVHLTEPYWHPVRLQQVIGRARRICSHSDLPIELQTVEVFLYLMKLSKKQIGDLSIELKLSDVSTLDKKKIITSDEFLYEISMIKEKLNQELLDNVKKSAIDCSIHSRTSSKEKITCFTIGNPNEDKLIYVPDIKNQENDSIMKLNKKTVSIKLHKIKNTNYALDKQDNKVYDYDAYIKGELLHIGNLEIIDGKNKIVFNK